MADDKTKQNAAADSKVAAARQRAAAMSKSGGIDPAKFTKETWNELKKTTWPDRLTLYKSTGIVLAFIALTAVWVGVLGVILQDLTKPLFGTN